jgi:hypothetical protein
VLAGAGTNLHLILVEKYTLPPGFGLTVSDGHREPIPQVSSHACCVGPTQLSSQIGSLPLYDLNRKGETPTPVSTSPDISDCWRLLQSNRQDRNSESTGIQLSDELRSLLVSILRLSRIEIRDHSDELELPGGALSDYIGH